MMSPALLRISLRMGKKRPFTTLLLVFGIALGVAGVVAIDIAKQSIARSFELSTSLLTAASTHQVTGSDFSIPQALFTDIRTRIGIKRSAPIMASHVKVPRLDNRTLTLMGIDPFSEQYFRKPAISVSEESNPLDISDLLTRPAGVLISGVFAESHGLAPHDSLVLSFGRREVQAEVIGFLDDREPNSKALSGIIITDISTAQEILGMEDRITRLDLILKNDTEIENIRSLLPQGTFLVETDRQNSALRGLSSSFETSLSAFSMLALFMGIFLIYNTVSFSVSSRKNLMGTLKALGADHRDIFKMVMLEIMVYALAGSLLGAGLGIILGKGAVEAVSATVSDMYFVLTVTQTHITPGTLFKGILAGIAGAQASPYRVWIDDWQVREKGGGLFLEASDEGLRLNLTLFAEKPVILQGDKGFSRKGPEPFNASYYYSLPDIKTSGKVEINGTAFSVRGRSWFDHEWSTSALSASTSGWDWFSIHLEDGRSLMLCRIRNREGISNGFGFGSLSRSDGRVRILSET